MNNKKILWQTIGLILITLLVSCGRVPNEPIATSTPVPPSATSGPRVLIVIRSYISTDMPNMTDNELGVMIDMLEDAGFELWIASHSYDPYKSETNTITPDLIIGSVNVADFDAVLIPCLATGLTSLSQEITELVKEFYNQEKVIAAQHGARLSLFRDKLITSDQMNSSGVLQNGKVITSGCCSEAAEYSGCEDGTRELIEKLIATLNEGE